MKIMFINSSQEIIAQRRRSLIGEILRIQLLFGVLIYLLAVSTFWITSNWTVENNLRKWAIQWTNELVELGASLYADGDNERFIRVEEYVKKFPEISYVHYYTEGGKLLFSGYADKSIKIDKNITLDLELRQLLSDVSSPEKPYFFDDGDSNTSLSRSFTAIWLESLAEDDLFSLDLSEDSTDQVRVAGFVELGMNYGIYKEQLVKNIITASLIFAVLFTLLLFIGRGLFKNALRPLSDLQQPLSDLARGETDIQVQHSPHHEIRSITRALKRTINALNERNETLRRLANHDSLTGLINRHYFSEFLESAIIDGKDNALFFIDVDNFKYVNDALGHAAGDRLLVQIARCLNNNLREDDVLSRFGGDEFTIILHDVSKQNAVNIADALLKSLQDLTFIEEGQAFNIYCSIGITMIDNEHYTPKELLSNADMACHEAKSRGRNCCYLYEPSRKKKEQLTADIGWSRRIDEALTNGHLFLEFQPIINVANGHQDMHEVLLRMTDEKGKIVSPNAFMPAAKRFGLMNKIDLWVIDNAIKALSEFQKQGFDSIFTINLSGYVFDDKNLVTTITKSLKEHDVSPTSVVFEITEQVGIRHMAKANVLVRNIISMGCEFALDDFGTGFSSFNYLKHLPVHYIKIDGNFIENMAHDPTDQAMVKSIIQIAKAVGKLTIAEYVQDATTLKILRDLGVDYAQGFYVGKPDITLAEKPFKIPRRTTKKRSATKK